MDTHIVMVKSIHGSWRIAFYTDSMASAKKFIPSKLKPFDMIVAAPIEAANPAVLYESGVAISVVDANKKIRKAPDLFEEIGDFENWIAAWELTDRQSGMLTMCRYIDRKAMIDMACDIASDIAKNSYDSKSIEDYVQYFNVVKSANSLTWKRSIKSPQHKRMPSFVNSVTNVILFDSHRDAFSSLTSMVETAFVYGYRDSVSMCEIIRSYVPLPVALLGKHAVK